MRQLGVLVSSALFLASSGLNASLDPDGKPINPRKRSVTVIGCETEAPETIKSPAIENPWVDIHSTLDILAKQTYSNKHDFGVYALYANQYCIQILNRKTLSFKEMILKSADSLSLQSLAVKANSQDLIDRLRSLRKVLIQLYVYPGEEELPRGLQDSLLVPRMVALEFLLYKRGCFDAINWHLLLGLGRKVRRACESIKTMPLDAIKMSSIFDLSKVLGMIIELNRFRQSIQSESK